MLYTAFMLQDANKKLDKQSAVFATMFAVERLNVAASNWRADRGIGHKPTVAELVRAGYVGEEVFDFVPMAQPIYLTEGIDWRSGAPYVRSKILLTSGGESTFFFPSAKGDEPWLGGGDVLQKHLLD